MAKSGKSNYGSDFETIEMADPETFMYSKDQAFSHPMNVTIAYQLVIRAGAQEMRKGWWETKTDKFGNHSYSWHEDTRNHYINSVKTLKNVLIANFDEKMKTNLKEINDKITALEKTYIDAEEKWYQSIPMNIKLKTQHISNGLSQELIFFQNMLDKKVEYYREIFEELQLLLSRQKYLKKADVRG